jgi:hypothetical protein
MAAPVELASKPGGEGTGITALLDGTVKTAIDDRKSIG